MSLVSENYVCTVLIYQVFKLFWYHCGTVTLLTKLFLCFFLLWDTMTWWWHCHFQVFLLTYLQTVIKTSSVCDVCVCVWRVVVVVRHIFVTFTIALIQPRHECLYSALSTPSAIALCFIVPTHHANETVGTPRSLFLVLKASLTMFSSLPSAKYLCWCKLLSVLPPCRPLQNEPQQ
jgi:hypothetical protein